MTSTMNLVCIIDFWIVFFFLIAIEVLKVFNLGEALCVAFELVLDSC